ncbi:MAG: lipoyl(octanoyl) transferase [Cyanobacteriota bacterium erpe_2018_sw_21hr_WHONDRS-SW48-000092_B_bin.40]|nr:lipoyl(octanoyl) transferase [Cyanobacteriota bacterium erpe_2018_sw_21hr_WHONDRS-SW48-000092_B_bin.40]
MTSVRARALRLIPYGVFDAVTNMAIDEALLELHLQGKTPATLRFYGWEPPAVSFGYSQKVSPRTVEKVRAAGYDAVRRPTGGRAVLHEGELTYCFVGAGPKQDGIDFRPDAEIAGAAPSYWLEQGSPYEGFLPGSINQAYKEICDALIYGLRELGVAASLGRSNSAYKDYEDCFQATTQADLQFDGKKIVGSAQLRRRHGVLQHGSIMINQSQTKLSEIFGVAEREKAEEPQNETIDRHCNLIDVLAGGYDRTSLEEAIGRGFTRKFDCHFAVYELTDEEMEFVEELKKDKNRYQIL